MQARETFSPANMAPVAIDVIEDQPANPGDPAYTIFTPNPAFKGVTLKRQFVRGRTIVYDVNVARQLVAEYGYRCEPALPPLPVIAPRPTKGRAKTYVKA